MPNDFAKLSNMDVNSRINGVDLQLPDQLALVSEGLKCNVALPVQ